MKLGESKLFILGAGFSKPAGFPLGAELWSEILSRTNHLTGRASKINDDIAAFIRYEKEVFGKILSPDKIDFEEFLGYLDFEHFLDLRGSETWSKDGNEGTIVVKNLIGEILTEILPVPANIPQLYFDFAQRLNPGDYVLTFNYDTLLETALDTLNKKYRLFPTKLESVGVSLGGLESGITDMSEEAINDIVVLKLHGSIDWFDKTSYLKYIEDRKPYKLETPPFHPIFNKPELLGLEKLIKGPCFSEDPLLNVFRATKGKNINYREAFFLASPLLLTPSTQKHVYFNKVHNFWGGMNYEGGLTSKLVLIGYSIPSYDPYAIQVLYRIVRNFQSDWYRKEYPWVKKENMVVITKCASDIKLNEYMKKRLRFVDWSRAVIKSDGFDNEALEIIFN
jgi:hypothetical protein